MPTTTEERDAALLLSKLHTLTATAARLGLSTRTIERWVQAKKLRTVRLPGGGLRVPESAIVEIEQGELAAK
jgi:excisionase family DNA binding protein